MSWVILKVMRPQRTLHHSIEDVSRLNCPPVAVGYGATWRGVDRMHTSGYNEGTFPRQSCQSCQKYFFDSQRPSW